VVVHLRRNIIYLLGVGLLMPLAVCGQERKEMKSYTVLDVEVFSSLDRSVGDIKFNDEDIGVMNKYGGTGLIAGVRVPFGNQRLTWMLDGPPGTPRNGEHVKVANTLMITPDKIPSGPRYLGIHIYPDFTAEVIFSESMPVRTARGKKLKIAWKN
jgi:hypothetical protein